MTIKTLKNFGSMNQSFKDWLTTCPREYIWQIDEVTDNLEGTFTFRRTNGSETENSKSQELCFFG